MSMNPFDPKSIAVIGASDNPNKVGGRAIYYMRKFGYTGELFAVNPAREQIQGLRSYKCIDDIGSVPDLVIIAVSGAQTLTAVQDCVRVGVSCAIIMASGFAEIGPKGRQYQQEMVDCARQAGMRLLGPNAQGLANFATGGIMNFSTMFMDVSPLDGPIAIISQSGAASVMPYALLREAGLGVRYLAATGNDADLGVCELVQIVAEDPVIRLILIYIEAVIDPDILAQAARVARQRGARLVLLKGGRSEKGSSAAASHTGAVVGRNGGLDAFLARHGIDSATDMRELICMAGLCANGHSPGNGRTAVVSHSGAVGVLCADAAERYDLPLTEFSDGTCQALDELLPSFGTASNPLDLTAALLGNKKMFPAVLDVLGNAREVDMLLIGLPVVGPGYDLAQLVQSSKQFSVVYNKPVVLSASQPSVRNAFQQAGIPTFITESDAVQALAKYARPPQVAEADFICDAPAGKALTSKGILDEAESLQLLQEYGVPVVPFIVCSSAEQAIEFASRLQTRVVIKGCASSVPHKTEHQLVHLNLQGDAAVRAAVADCFDKLQRLDIVEPRVIVAAMVQGEHEFMLGAVIDPVFGPIITMGEGGTLVEIRRDVVSLLAPFSVQQAMTALKTLKIAPVLDGVRKGKRLDTHALAKAAVALADFSLAHRNELKSVDLNPVLVMPEGKGVIVVDALVELEEIK